MWSDPKCLKFKVPKVVRDESELKYLNTRVQGFQGPRMNKLKAERSKLKGKHESKIRNQTDLSD